MATPKNALVISMVGLCFLNLIASIDATALSVSLPVRYHFIIHVMHTLCLLNKRP